MGLVISVALALEWVSPHTRFPGEDSAYATLTKFDARGHD